MAQIIIIEQQRLTYMQGLKHPQVRHTVEIKSVTWNKDSHGLFDYECKSLSQRKFSLENSVTLMRDQKTSDVDMRLVEQMALKKETPPDNVMLAEIVKEEGDAVSQPPRYLLKIQQEPSTMDIEEPKQQPYLIVRSLKMKEGGLQRGYPLGTGLAYQEIGDIIKLGRIQYLVSELKTNTETFSAAKIKEVTEKIYEVPMNLEGQCKICTEEHEEGGNFFVSPCHCKGSCNVVHINCLKRWINEKMVVKQHEAATSYNFTKFQCEICKDPYPKTVIKDGEGHQLFVLKRPEGPYIILQAVQQEPRQNKALYLITAPKPLDLIKLGRGHQCQIRITDISVSREHAHIKYEKDQFVIYDNSSKFGTLIKLQKDLPICRNKIAIQFGRTVMTLKSQSFLDVEKDRTSQKRLPC